MERARRFVSLNGLTTHSAICKRSQEAGLISIPWDEENNPLSAKLPLKSQFTAVISCMVTSRIKQLIWHL
jgi:hypothetical protein